MPGIGQEEEEIGEVRRGMEIDREIEALMAMIA